MALLFDDASLQYLTNAAAAVGGSPCSVSAWFNCDVNNIGQAIVSLSANNTGAGQMALVLDGGNNSTNGAGKLIWFRRSAISSFTAGLSAFSGSTVSTGAWHHGLGVENTSSDRRVYLDAVRGTDGNILADTTAPINTVIGRLGDTTPNFETSGAIAEVGIWDAALTDAEAAMLALGASPLLVRPGNLVSYWPIIGRFSPEIDIVGGLNMTLTSGPIATPHTRVFYPKRRSA